MLIDVVMVIKAKVNRNNKISINLMDRGLCMVEYTLKIREFLKKAAQNFRQIMSTRKIEDYAEDASKWVTIFVNAHGTKANKRKPQNKYASTSKSTNIERLFVMQMSNILS